MRFLHLSDLHFGYDDNATQKAQRENLLNSLIETVTKFNQLDYIFITGDIVWQCKNEGFDSAQKWIDTLSKNTKVPLDHFIVCPGNHEHNQNESKDISYISSADKAAQSLNVERLHILSRKFQQYIDFCDKMGFAKLVINDIKNYLVGTYNSDKLKIIVFNSAWYALNGGLKDKNHLWLGRPFFDLIMNEANQNPKELTVTLFHHPQDWLNENETQTQDTNNSLFELIAQIAQLNFTGHTHGNIQEPNLIHNSMRSFTAGATYKENNYYNNFSIYEVERQSYEIGRVPFLSKNGTEWEEHGLKKYTLNGNKINSRNKTPNASDENIEIKSNYSYLRDIFEQIDVNMIKVTESDFGNNKIMIWPVVPRLMLTTIHLAQLELMKILCLDFGWSVHAIISNCGAKPLPKEAEKAFEEKIKRYFNKAGVTNYKIEYLEMYFRQNHELASKVLQSFIDISSNIKLPMLRAIKEKNYDEEKKKAVNEQEILNYILPVLQFAVIKAISCDIKQNQSKRSIIIAGNDENIQWTNAVTAIGEDFIGALLIPEMNKGDGFNVNQSNDLKPIIECVSKQQLFDNIEGGNILDWFNKMFLMLPNYKEVNFTSKSSSWITQKGEFVKEVWKRVEESSPDI